jgi:hypothetical protein
LNRFLVIIVLLAISGFICKGQEFIGKHKEEVRLIMSTERKDVHIDQSSKNTVYNLLKYIDALNTQTILFVFNDMDTCIYYKTIYDYMYLRQVERELNQKYTKTGPGSWYFYSGNNRYLVTLKKEKWYFSVLVNKEDKQQKST